MRWALQFTSNDRERAEDLVQEVFSQLILTHSDLSEIKNIAAYLYTALHNTHVSQVRMAVRSHTQSLSVIEYNLADTAVHSGDPSLLYQTQDQLRRICQFACARKQSSKASSILILRFFHGYHISEAANVVGATSEAIRQCLRFARHEARLFLENPAALAFIDRAQLMKLPSHRIVQSAEELLSDLRRAVFRSCQGDCLTADSLRAFYQMNSSLRSSSSVVAHLVSCRRCLDTVNRELGIPLLADRFGEDSDGADDDARPGLNGAGGGKRSESGSHLRKQTKTQQGTRRLLLRFRRHVRELIECYPRELRVSVNGHLLGSHFVNSELSRMRLDITLAEPVSFLEVMTEENTRLLVMNIDPPPNGDPRQARRVLLSDDRSLEATLQYGHPWPMLEVVYHNPCFEADAPLQVPELDGPANVGVSKAESAKLEFVADQPQARGSADLARQAGPTFKQMLSDKRKQVVGRMESWRRSFLAGFSHLSNVGVVTAIVSIILICALLLVWLNPNPTPELAAANLLKQARIAEDATGARVDEAVHRVVTLETRNYRTGVLISKNRIDLWRDATGKSSRSVYDDRGQLIAGEWVKNNHPDRNHSQASSLILQRGQKPRFESSVLNVQLAINNLELWRLEPSVKNFGELIGDPELSRVEEKLDAYVITYSAGPAEGNKLLLTASLKLRKSDLHAEEQSLVLRWNNQSLEYRFVEANFERCPIDSIPPKMFEPDVELFDDRGATERRERRPVSSSVPFSVSSSAPVASSELEVEVAFLLDQFRTRFGDQISLSRTDQGTLLVQAIVDTNEAKAELLRALGPVDKNPAVNIEVSTAAEMLQRQQRNGFGAPVVRQFSGSDDRIPAYEVLHRYFSGQAASGQRDNGGQSSTDDSTDKAMRMFATQVVARSRRALSHAIELKQLNKRFPPKTVNALTSDARKKWFGMIHDHAAAVRAETVVLIEQLRPVFFVSNDLDKHMKAVDITSDEELAMAIEQLCRVAIANDEAIRSTFSASFNRPESLRVKEPGFGAALGTVRDLAERVQRAAFARQ